MCDRRIDMSKNYATATATATVYLPEEKVENPDDWVSYSTKVTRKARKQFSNYCRDAGLTHQEALNAMFLKHAVLSKEYYQDQIDALKVLRDSM